MSDRVGAELRVVPQRLPAVVKPLVKPVMPAPVRPVVTPAAVAGPAVEAELHSWFPARDASFAGGGRERRQGFTGGRERNMA